MPPKGWLDVLWRTSKRASSDNIGLLAAGVAFYWLLSLVPGITAAVAITGLFLDPGVLIATSDIVTCMLPDGASEIVLGQLRDVAGADSTSLSFAALIALALSVYSASRAMSNLIISLNIVYEERETRGMIALFLRGIVLTVGVTAGLILSLIVVAALPAVAAWLEFTLATQIVLFLRWPVLFLLGTAGIATLYRFGPNRRPAKLRWLTPGALVACCLWVAGSYGFSFYVQSFGSYNETFGALGGVIVLLTWLWLSAYIVILGALLDAETEAQTRKDTTQGPDRPMGQRGAVKADTLGPSFNKVQKGFAK